MSKTSEASVSQVDECLYSSFYLTSTCFTCLTHTRTHMHTHIHTHAHTHVYTHTYSAQWQCLDIHSYTAQMFVDVCTYCLFRIQESRPSLVGENTVGGKSTTCMGYNTLHYLQYITYMQLFNNHLRMHTAETSIFKWGPKVSYPTSLQKDKVQTKSFLPYP